MGYIPSDGDEIDVDGLMAEASKITGYSPAKPTATSTKVAGYRPLARSTGNKDYDSWYDEEGKKHDVDPNLLFAQGHTESWFKSNAVSPKNARGIAQFIPGTAKEFGVNVNDPRSSIGGQAKLMRQLLDRTGDIDLALAGYNSGHRHSIARLRQNKERIPETRNYVRQIRSAYDKTPNAQPDYDIGSLLAEASRITGYAPTGMKAANPASMADVPGTDGPYAPVAIGDSIAAGLIWHAGIKGKANKGVQRNFSKGATASVGATPTEILANIKAMKDGSLRGQSIVLSTGASNDPNDLEAIKSQIENLRQKGVSNITILGVGPHSKLTGVNDRLAKIAKESGVTFTGPLRTGTDQIHPSGSGWGQLAGLLPTSATRPAAAKPPKDYDIDSLLAEASRITGYTPKRMQTAEPQAPQIATDPIDELTTIGKAAKQGIRYDQMPVTERPETLNAQRFAANSPKSTRAGVLYTDASTAPPITEQELDIPIQGNQVLRVNKLKFQQYQNQTGISPELISIGQADFTPLIGGKAQPTGEVAGTTGKIAVMSIGKDGKELVSSSVTDPSAVIDEAILHKKQFPDEPMETKVVTADEVIAARQPDATTTDPGQLEGTDTSIVEVPDEQGTGFTTSGFDVDPANTPEIADKGEAVYRQAVGQLGRQLYGRDLNELEMAALVDEQRKAAGGFAYERGTGKAKSVDGKDRYVFEPEDVKRISGILNQNQEQFAQIRDKALSGFMELGLPLDEKDFGNFVAMGFTPEEIVSAFSSDPKFEATRKQGDANRELYKANVDRYMQEPGMSPQLASLKAYRDIGAVSDAKVAEFEKAEKDSETEKRGKQFIPTPGDYLGNIVGWIKDNWSTATLAGGDVGNFVTDPSASGGMLGALWADAPSEFRSKALDPAEREKARKDAMDSWLQSRRQQFGSLQEYDKYMSSQQDTFGRHVENFGRGAVELLGNIPKTIANIDSVNEKLNPLGYIIPKDYMPSLRTATNALGYLAGVVSGKGYEFESADKSLDQRNMYKFGDWISKRMGEDPYMQDSKYGWASSGAASGVMFLLGGAALKGVKYGAGTLGALTQIGGTYDDLKRAGVPDGEAQAWAIAVGAPLGFSEQWGLGGTAERALAKLGTELSEDATKTLMKSFMDYFTRIAEDSTRRTGAALYKGAKQVARAGAEGVVSETPEEFLQEWGQSTFSAAAINAISAKDKSAGEKIKKFIAEIPKQAVANLPQGIQGGVLGGVLGGGTNTLVGGVNAAQQYDRGTPRPTLDEMMRGNRLAEAKVDAIIKSFTPSFTNKEKADFTNVRMDFDPMQRGGNAVSPDEDLLAPINNEETAPISQPNASLDENALVSDQPPQVPDAVSVKDSTTDAPATEPESTSKTNEGSPTKSKVDSFTVEPFKPKDAKTPLEVAQEENPAKRIATPKAAAVAAVAKDGRAIKIANILEGSHSKTLAEIVKATKFTPEKVQNAIRLMYDAGKIEIRPDNGIKLIEPVVDLNQPLYDQFDEQGVIQPKAAPVEVPVAEQNRLKWIDSVNNRLDELAGKDADYRQHLSEGRAIDKASTGQLKDLHKRLEGLKPGDSVNGKTFVKNADKVADKTSDTASDTIATNAVDATVGSDISADTTAVKSEGNTVRGISLNDKPQALSVSQREASDVVTEALGVVEQDRIDRPRKNDHDRAKKIMRLRTAMRDIRSLESPSITDINAILKRVGIDAIAEQSASNESKKQATPKSKHKSLSQFVRSQGGIRSSDYDKGEHRRISNKETGTTGLINKNSKYTAEEMAEQAWEAGYLRDEWKEITDRNGNDFLNFVEDDYTGVRKIYSQEALNELDTDFAAQEEEYYAAKQTDRDSNEYIDAQNDLLSREVAVLNDKDAQKLLANLVKEGQNVTDVTELQTILAKYGLEADFAESIIDAYREARPQSETVERADEGEPRASDEESRPESVELTRLRKELAEAATVNQKRKLIAQIDAIENPTSIESVKSLVPRIADMAVRVVDTASESSRMYFGRAVRFENGEIKGVHVTDGGRSIASAIAAGDLLYLQSQSEGRELGPGLYISNTPEMWAARANGEPKNIPITAKGRFIEFDDAPYPTIDEVEALVKAGFDGAFTPGSKKAHAELVIWNPKAIDLSKSVDKRTQFIEQFNLDPIADKDVLDALEGSGVSLFSRSAPDTPAFERWFGDSKVVDANGKPLVVYHGTREADLESFTAGQNGIHFGTVDAAEDRFHTYKGRGRDNLNVIPAYLSIQNPKRVEDNGGDWSNEIAEAKKEGHDGLIYKNDWEDAGSTSFVAFNPEQVKSAIGNNGNFDPAEPSILRSIAASTQPFYSRVERVIADKMPPKATKEQITALLAKNSVKELDPEAQMVKVWLEDQGGSVSKADVLEFVAANKVEVQEVVKGRPSEKWQTIDDWGEGVEEAVTSSELYDIGPLDDGRFLLTSVEDDKDVGKFDSIDEAKRAAEKDLNDHIAYDEGTLPRFSQYQLPGESENYREEFLTAPSNKVVERLASKYGIPLEMEGALIQLENTVTDAEWNEWKQPENATVSENWKDGHSDYADVKNPIVRLRYADRTTTDGDSMLFGEEIQQPGEGQFEKMPKVYQKYGELIGIKKLLFNAVQGGYDYLGLTTGKQQVDRYANDLRQNVDQIDWHRTGDNTVKVESYKDGVKGLDHEFNIEGETTISGHTATLSRIVGKQIANDIKNAAVGDKNTVSGDGLTIGGEALAGRYDKGLVGQINKLLKPYGSSVEMKALSTTDFSIQEFGAWASKKGHDNFEIVKDWNTGGPLSLEFESQKGEPVYAVKITPALIEAVERELEQYGGGFPLLKIRTTEDQQALYDVLPFIKNAGEFFEFPQVQSFNEETGELELTIFGKESERRILANVQAKRLGRKVAVPQSDAGVYDVGTLKAMEWEARSQVKTLKENGYPESYQQNLVDLADGLNKAAKHAKDFGILYAFDDALPEERFHQEDLRAGRTDAKAIAELKNSPFWDGSAKFDETYGKLSDADKASEIVAKLATGQEAEYGWDKVPGFAKARDTFFDNWLEGVIRNNGSVIAANGIDAFLNKFQRIGKLYAETKTGQQKESPSKPEAGVGTERVRGSSESGSEEARQRTDETGELIRDKTPRQGEADKDRGSVGIPELAEVEADHKNRQYAETLRDAGFTNVPNVPYIPGTDAAKAQQVNHIIEASKDDNYVSAEKAFYDKTTDPALKGVLGTALIDHLGSIGEIDRMMRIARDTIEHFGTAGQMLQAAKLAAKYDFATGMMLATKAKAKTGKDLTHSEIAKVEKLLGDVAKTTEEKATLTFLIDEMKTQVADAEVRASEFSRALVEEHEARLIAESEADRLKELIAQRPTGRRTPRSMKKADLDAMAPALESLLADAFRQKPVNSISPLYSIAARSNPTSLKDDVYDAFVKLAMRDILSNKSPDELIQHLNDLSNGELSKADIADIQADAFEATKGDRVTLDKDARTKIANRQAHAKMARESRPKLGPDKPSKADILANKYGDKINTPSRPNMFESEVISYGQANGYTEAEILGALLLPKTRNGEVVEKWNKVMGENGNAKTFKRSYDLRQKSVENIKQKQLEVKAEKEGYGDDIQKLENQLRHNGVAGRYAKQHFDAYAKKLSRSWGEFTLAVASEVVSVFKGLTTWGEISYVLRQGLIPLITNTGSALKGDWQGIGHGLQGDNELWKWLADKGGFEQASEYLSNHSTQMFIEKIRQHPRFLEAQNNGARFTQIGDFNIADDHFSSKVLEGIPFYRRTELAYTLPGDLQRLYMYDNFASIIDSQNLTREEVKTAKRYAADVVNAFTGKGDVGKVLAKQGTLAKLLNLAFFSPQLLFSRFQSFNKLTTGFVTAPKGMKWQMAKKGMRFYGFVGLLALLTGMALDPDDDDFGKINIKKDSALAKAFPEAQDMHLDFLGGMDVPMQLWFRTALGLAKSLANGDKGYFQDAMAANMQDFALNKQGEARFARGKLAPGASIAADVYKGSDFLGRPLSVWGELTTRMLPMSWQQIYDAALYDRYRAMVKEPQDFENAKQKLKEREIKYLNAFVTMILTGLGAGITQYPKDEQSDALQLARTLSPAVSKKDAETLRQEGGLRNLLKAQNELLQKGESTEKIDAEIKRWTAMHPDLVKNFNKINGQADNKTGMLGYYLKDLNADQIKRVREKATDPDEIEMIDKALEKAGGAKAPEGSVDEMLNAPEMRKASTDDLVELMKLDDYTPEDREKVAEALRKKARNAQKSKTLTPDEVERIKAVLPDFKIEAKEKKPAKPKKESKWTGQIPSSNIIDLR